MKLTSKLCILISFFIIAACGHLKPPSQAEAERQGFHGERMAYKNTHQRKAKEKKSKKTNGKADKDMWGIADEELKFKGKIREAAKAKKLSASFKKDRRWQVREIDGKKRKLPAPKEASYLDRQEVRQAILNNISEVRKCYRQAKKLAKKRGKSTKSVAGKLVFKFDINDKGEINSLRTKSNTTKSSKLSRCVKRRLRKWDFPKAPKDQIARVTYPFIFTKKKVSARRKAAKHDRIYIE